MGQNHFLLSENHQGRGLISLWGLELHTETVGPHRLRGSLCCQTALQSHTSLLGSLQAAGTVAGRLGVLPGEEGGSWGDSNSFRRKWGLSSLLFLEDL